MIEVIRDYLPWLLSLLTLIHMYIAGDNHPKTWIFGIFNQCLWLVYVVGTQSWGFLPMTIALFIIYIRNHGKRKTASV